MSSARAVLLTAMVACTAGAQQNPVDQTEPAVPRSVCRYERLSAIRQVKLDPPVEDLSDFFLSSIVEHRVYFRPGTIVTVSRREGSWSCVTGPWLVASSGWPFRTGWMKTALLGQVEKQQPASGGSEQ